jgi:cytochrome c biogenesis protein ResB
LAHLFSVWYFLVLIICFASSLRSCLEETPNSG